MSADDVLIAGVYRHYKGPLYLVMGLAHDANEDGRVAVLYVPLQLDDAHPGPRLAVRTLEDFRAIVCTRRSCPGYGVDVRVTGGSQGACGEHDWSKRFEYVSAQWRPEPPPERTERWEVGL
jgi:hypothetical protein